jgi:hypothetical protein
MRARKWQETSMGIHQWVLAGTAFLSAGAAGAASTLDGRPARTDYLSNAAPFVVFGVTPTRLDRRAARLLLTFVATDRLERVDVFPFVRSGPGAPALLRNPVACGPRDAGSWDCAVPVAGLLADLGGPRGELGLRIEAHGDLRDRGEHSTVVVTLPVRPAAARPARRKERAAPSVLSD